MDTETATLLVVSYREFFKILQFVIEKSSCPYDVLTATNTPDALNTFMNSKPDLVLSANVLAEDHQLLKQIRTLPGGEEIPFIVICSSFNEDILSNLGKLGAHKIFTPFRPNELLSVIQSCLDDFDA